MTRIISRIQGISVDENGNVIIENGIVYGQALTPPSLIGNTNDYYPLGLETTVLLRLSSNGNYELTGLKSPTPPSAQEIKIFNVGTNNITFKDNSASSLADNRFLMGGNKTLQTNEGIAVIYDPVSLRWRGTGIII